jgi:hypothetical protein
MGSAGLLAKAAATADSAGTLASQQRNGQACNYISPPLKMGGWPSPRRYDSYLVDSASSHMLVSKIKPCMSKYKQLYSETANGSLNQLSFI